MATQLVLVQSLGVRVLPPEQEAAFDAVETMTAAQMVSISDRRCRVVLAPFV